jgi:hypothetical protein
MDIRFKRSAFEHNISEANIRHAFAYPLYDGPIEDTDETNRYIRLGLDTSGNLLEMLYNEYDDYVCIFHAMGCRSIFLIYWKFRRKLWKP